MAFQQVPNTAEITFVYFQNNKNVVNSVHAEKIGGYDASQIANLANLMDAAAATYLIPQLVADVTYLRVDVRGLDSENDFQSSEGASTGPGTTAGPGLPGNVTLSIKRSSAFTGRSARGRWYWVGLAAGELLGNENQVDANVANNKAIAVQGIRTSISNAGWVPVIVSRYTNGQQRSIGVLFDWLTTSVVNSNVDSQRGRLLG